MTVTVSIRKYVIVHGIRLYMCHINSSKNASCYILLLHNKNMCFAIISANFVGTRNMFCSDAKSSSTTAEISVSMETLSSTPTTGRDYTATSSGTTVSVEPTSDGANVFENSLICCFLINHKNIISIR